MTATIPPITEALKDYRIDPENLWVVFVTSTPDAQARGRPAITQPLFLADPGEVGRKQIERIEASDPYYLGSFSFLELKAAMKKLDEDVVLEAKPTGLGKLLPTKTYFIPVSMGSSAIFYQVKATSLKDAVALLAQRHPEGRVGLGGNRQDVEALIARMEKVILEQRFWGVATDRREPIKTWDADRLLFAKKNPDMAPQLFPYPEQYELLK